VRRRSAHHTTHRRRVARRAPPIEAPHLLLPPSTSSVLRQGIRIWQSFVVSTEGRRPEWRDLLSTISSLSPRKGLSARPFGALVETTRPYAIALRLTGRCRVSRHLPRQTREEESHSQRCIPIARYIVVAAVRCLEACSSLPWRRYRLPRPRWQWATIGRKPSFSPSASAWR